MNWPGFYSLGNAWLFVLLIPLIIVYFLKLKRPRKEIPSLTLWRQVINDQRVNSPFQKFKRNMLLLLQMLLLLCLILAALQPFLPAGVEQANYTPILIDNSASMGAVDQSNGQNRLDIVKQDVLELIDNLPPDHRMSLITVSSSARRLTDFTDNKRVLRDALAGIEVDEVASQLDDGLRMAQALVRTVRFDSLLFFTDGNVPADVEFDLPFELNYQRLEGQGANIGVTSLNARRSSDSRWDIFVRIEGTPYAQTAAELELLQDGEIVGTESVLLERAADDEQTIPSQRLAFSVDSVGPSSLELRVKPDGFDALASDNVAHIDLPESRHLSVYAPLNLAAFRHALGARPDVDVYPTDESGQPAARYDLLITDTTGEANPEANVTIYVGVIPDDLSELIDVETGSGEVVDWQRNSPLLQHVELTDVQMADEPKTKDEIRDGDFEEQGYEILAFGRTGPLILKKRQGKSLAYYFLFHPDRSTLPYRVGFPILVANMVQAALDHADLAEVRANRTGIIAGQTLRPESHYVVETPDDQRIEIESNEEGLVPGISANRVGRYQYRESGDLVAEIGASLLAPAETSLRSIREIQFREVSVTSSDAAIETDQPLWPYFALAAFAFLLVEWWYFQKRPGGVPV